MHKINTKRQTFINTFFSISQTIADKSFFLIINIIVARYLDATLFGEYSTALAYATLFSTFTDIGVNSTLFRSISIEKNLEKQHIANAFFLKTGLAIIVYFIMSVSLFFTGYNINVIYLALIFGLVRIGTEYLNLFYAIYTAREQFIKQSIIIILFSFLFLLSTIGVVLIKGNSNWFAFTRLIFVGVFIFFLAKKLLLGIDLKFDKNSLKTFLPQAFYFGISSIFSNLYQRINIILLSLIQSTIYSGFFSNAYIFFQSLFFIPNSLSRVLISHLYKIRYEDNHLKFQFAYDVYSKILYIISFYIFILLFLFAKDIILLIYGSSYLPTVNILRITSLAIPPLFNVASIMLIAIDRQKERTRCQFIGLIFNIILNLLLIYFYKGEGAALATVLTYLGLNMMYHYYISKFTKISFKKSNILLLKLLIITSICFLFYYYILIDLLFIFSFIIISALFLLLLSILIIEKNDIRIVREIITGKGI